MKTLDEVIKAEEICSQIDAECSKCPYKATAKGWCEEKDRDALHYLKEYRKLDSLEAVASPEDDNPPLTWDELREMVGKPVWFVYDWNNTHHKGWILLDHMEGIFIVDAKDCWALSETNMDKWRAFRKERE